MRKYVQKSIAAGKSYFIPPSRNDFGSELSLDVILAGGRERILTSLLRFTSVLALFGIASTLENLISKSRWDLLSFYLLMAFAIWVISYNRKIPYSARLAFFLGITYILAVVDLAFVGIAEDWRLYLFGLSVLVTIFLGWRMGVVAIFVSELTFISIAWQISVGNIVITASHMASPVPSKMSIFIFALMFLMVTGVVVSAVAAVMREFEAAWQRERVAVGIIEEERDLLEDRVVGRTLELQEKNVRLKAALKDIKILKGMLPICASCKKIRDDNGYWFQIESYIREHSAAEFSHSICPDCVKNLYPEYIQSEKKKTDYS